MKKFKNLKVWQKGIKLVVDVYKNTNHFPKEELYGLTSQIKRSAVSIPSNIAEGSGRSTNKDFNRFLDIALGSSFELETQLIIAHELEFINNDNWASKKHKIDTNHQIRAARKAFMLLILLRVTRSSQLITQ